MLVDTGRVGRRLAGSRTALLTALATLSIGFAQSTALAQSCDTVLHSWEGIPFDSSLNPRKHPPDPHGGAGPQGVLATATMRVAYYAKDGTATWGPVCLRDFFGTPQSGCTPTASGGTPPSTWTDFVTDPRALYDPGSQRFYVIIAEEYLVSQHPEQSHSYLNVAVSRSSNPTTSDASSWIVNRLDITSVVNGCHMGDDYPGLAVDGQALYLTYDLASLGDACDDPPAPTGIHIVAIDKASLLTSQPAWTSTITPDGVTTLVPVSVLGSSSPGNVAYFAQVGGGTSASITLWVLSNPLSAGRTLTSSVISVPAYGSVASAPQPTPCNPLDTRSGVPQGNAFWHDGALRFVATGSANGRAQLCYFRVATNGFPNGTPTLVETAYLAGGDSWYQPAIGGNARGDEGIVFTRSSATETPTIAFLWRRNGDATFRGPVTIKSSATCYTAQGESIVRWGDYASVSADPTDQSFWLCHEWVKGSGEKEWGTWWAHLAPCPTPIGNLAAASPTGRHTVILNWTEPAYAASYDLRYSSSTITEANFASASTFATGPVPTGVAGTTACFTATGLVQCHTYYFAIKWTDNSGLLSGISNVPSATTRCSGADVFCSGDGLVTYNGPDDGSADRSMPFLEAPQPTPAVSAAEFRYQVGSGQVGGDLELAVFDVFGRRLRTLEHQAAAPGSHSVVWDLAAADGRRVGPGPYFVRLRVGAWNQTRTMLIVR